MAVSSAQRPGFEPTRVSSMRHVLFSDHLSDLVFIVFGCLVFFLFFFVFVFSFFVFVFCFFFIFHLSFFVFCFSCLVFVFFFHFFLSFQIVRAAGVGDASEAKRKEPWNARVAWGILALVLLGDITLIFFVAPFYKGYVYP